MRCGEAASSKARRAKEAGRARVILRAALWSAARPRTAFGPGYAGRRRNTKRGAVRPATSRSRRLQAAGGQRRRALCYRGRWLRRCRSTGFHDDAPSAVRQRPGPTSLVTPQFSPAPPACKPADCASIRATTSSPEPPPAKRSPSAEPPPPSPSPSPTAIRRSPPPSRAATASPSPGPVPSPSLEPILTRAGRRLAAAP